MVRAFSRCLPSHLGVLDPSISAQLYQYRCLWHLDQSTEYNNRPDNLRLAAATIMELADATTQKVWSDDYISRRFNVSCSLLHNPVLARILTNYSGIIGGCLRLAFYIHRTYMEQHPGTTEPPSRLSTPPLALPLPPPAPPPAAGTNIVSQNRSSSPISSPSSSQPCTSLRHVSLDYANSSATRTTC